MHGRFSRLIQGDLCLHVFVYAAPGVWKTKEFLSAFCKYSVIILYAGATFPKITVFLIFMDTRVFFNSCKCDEHYRPMSIIDVIDIIY